MLIIKITLDITFIIIIIRFTIIIILRKLALYIFSWTSKRKKKYIRKHSCTQTMECRNNNNDDDDGKNNGKII